MKAFQPVKVIRVLGVVNLFLILLPSTSVVSTFIGGGWCPYKTVRMIPCRVQNGSETYFGPDLCWVTRNGSTSCSKRVMKKPKYVTVYKKITETMYKCCPGLEGSGCQNECFNCSSVKVMQSKLNSIETAVKGIEAKMQQSVHGFLNSNQTEDIENAIDSEEDFTFDNTDILSTLKNDIRAIEVRLKQLEEKFEALLSTVKTVITLKNDRVDEASSRSDDLLSQSLSTSNRAHPLTPVARTRQSETNLERGDIASTINDEYEEEQSTATEEYADLLFISQK